MQKAAVYIIILLMVLAGGICLQIFLSKKENRLYGLILPIISFLFSFSVLFNIAALNGEDIWISVGSGVLGFIAANIPTIVLMAIYFSCREKFRRNKELRKMDVQDL